jgi:succinoglycan biosynthesis transport protein ExoP
MPSNDAPYLPERNAMAPLDALPGPFMGPPAPAPGASSLRRYLSALRRYYWLAILSAVLGAGAAAVVFKLTPTEYIAQGAIWIARGQDPNQGQSQGPITQGQLLEEQAWVDLLRSFTVLDSVAMRERLFVRYAPGNDSVFGEFALEDRFRPGEYLLTITPDGSTYTLSDSRVGSTLETGRTGDAIGAVVGFIWAPERTQLRPGASYEFNVIPPRAAAIELNNRLGTRMDQRANFLRLELPGDDPRQITRVLKSLMERHGEVAASLKSGQLFTVTEILSEQLAIVEDSLRQAELDLQSFRVRTITLPSDESAPIASGLALTLAPAIDDFFRMRLDLEALKQDRERLEAAVAQIPANGVQPAAFELIERVETSSALTTAFTELTAAQADLRRLQNTYTDEHQPIKSLHDRIAVLETQTIPNAARVLITELTAQERMLANAIASRATELQEIPPRTIEENQLQRRVDIAQALYTDLRQRHETATLAERSSVPDVSILDQPVEPTAPSNDKRIQFAAIAFLGLFGMGIGGIVLLEHLDPKLRHPGDVLDKMGLEIVGIIPRVTRGRRGQQKNLDQAREAFRELRMRIQYGYGHAKGPMLLAITSPAQGEGKTFVSANLAISFSELNLRTLLIDGDTRQGNLHELLGTQRKPGLTDALAGLEDGRIVQPTSHANLYFIGFGSRQASSPDLLNSPRMQELLSLAKRHYDLILIDCPPLGAGSDAFILGAHTGNVVVVLRGGKTNKEFAAAKLEPFYRLPVRMLGAVINDLDSSAVYGPYKYYSSYVAGYEAVGEIGDGTGEPAITGVK